jgi:hypothetical protein
MGTIRPGVPINDKVLLRSTFEEPAAISLYAADAKPAVGGGFGFTGNTDKPTEVGRWLTVGSKTVTVPAGGSVLVPVRLLVPKGVEGGEYVGGVVAERADSAPTTAVQTRTRFAMAVYLKVPGGAVGSTPGRGKPKGRLQLIGVDPHFKGGDVCPVVHYRNDSQDIVDPRAEVRTRGLFGTGTTRQQSRTGALLPGAEATVRLACISRPMGPGSVEITLSSPKGEGHRAIDYRWLPVPMLFALLLLLLLIAALVSTFVRGILRRRGRSETAGSAEREGG